MTLTATDSEVVGTDVVFMAGVEGKGLLVLVGVVTSVTVATVALVDTVDTET